jgi:thioester reductase-like protein
MKKLMLALVLFGFSLNTYAYNEGSNEIQLDSFFEANQNTQLQADKEFVAQEAQDSRKQEGDEKARVKQLQRDNAKLDNEIRKQKKLVKERQKLAAKETRKAQSLERQALNKQKQIEKLKIKNVSLRKSIDTAREKQKIAAHKVKAQHKHMKTLKVAHKNLKGKKQAILKRGKGGKIRTAAL